MLYRAYNFIMKRITRSLNVFLNKEETKLLKSNLFTLKTKKLIFRSHIPENIIRVKALLY